MPNPYPKEKECFSSYTDTNSDWLDILSTGMLGSTGALPCLHLASEINTFICFLKVWDGVVDVHFGRF